MSLVPIFRYRYSYCKSCFFFRILQLAMPSMDLLTFWAHVSHLHDCCSVILHHSEEYLVSVWRQFNALLMLERKNLKSILDKLLQLVKAMGIYYCRFASTARMLQKLPHIFFIILKKFHYYQTYKGSLSNIKSGSLESEKSGGKQRSKMTLFTRGSSPALRCSRSTDMNHVNPQVGMHR